MICRLDTWGHRSDASDGWTKSGWTEKMRLAASRRKAVVCLQE